MLKIGEYTRINGKIGKVKDIILNRNNYEGSGIYLENEKFVLGKEEIYKLKSSYNIIDLIEEGDYVNGVEVIGKEFDNFNKEYLQCGVGDYVICTFEVKDIKTILTKEQYENNCYKVDDKQEDI